MQSGSVRQSVTNMRASGWFLVDQARGAVVQTGTYYLDSLNQSAEIVVQYAQDATLGMWVPSEMNEVYLSATGSLLVKGTAIYSRLRRFQVTTEEKIKSPKQVSAAVSAHPAQPRVLRLERRPLRFRARGIPGLSKRETAGTVGKVGTVTAPAA